MSPPTLWQSFRQLVGRAFRESGQALDRLAIKTASLAVTKHDYYDDPVIYEDFLSRHRHQMPLLWSGKPVVDPDAAYIAPCSTLIGSVRVGPGSSIWYGAVLRADQCQNAEAFRDENPEPFEISTDSLRDRKSLRGGGIFIGKNTNVQDGCIITAREGHTQIGDGVTIGHLAQIHSATVKDFCLIGMGSVISEGAVIESESFVAAGAVVPPGHVVGTGELWVGNPARKVRDLTDEQRQKLHYQSSEYVNVAATQKEVMQLGGNAASVEQEPGTSDFAQDSGVSSDEKDTPFAELEEAENKRAV